MFIPTSAHSDLTFKLDLIQKGALLISLNSTREAFGGLSDQWNQKDQTSQIRLMLAHICYLMSQQYHDRLSEAPS